MTDIPSTTETVLVVESDVIARHVLAQYLRHCGYVVLEAASSDEALVVLSQAEAIVHVVLSAVELDGEMNGFALASWVRANRPETHVVLAGTVKKAAEEAGEICEDGPHLQRPYDPQQVLDWIQKLRNIPRRTADG
ncbi:response regulator [Roseococcus sp.]|uniref:response regulator n=1 Tax=Roseococcus sp. TaxID=2109646 RepID=UPI003BAB677D